MIAGRRHEVISHRAVTHHGHRLAAVSMCSPSGHVCRLHSRSANIRTDETCADGLFYLRNMPKKLDITGQRFGRLVAQPRPEKVGRRILWTCICDCGGFTQAGAGSLRYGNPQSCGCLQREAAARSCVERSTTHGMSRHRLMNILHSMRQRCYYEKSISYPSYGGRGIRVCDEWMENSEAFFAWAIANGYDDSLSIDRIDNSGNYTPENCRFASVKEQAENRRTSLFVEYQGRKITAAAFADELRIGRSTVLYRLKAGWTPERIANTPNRSKAA